MSEMSCSMAGTMGEIFPINQGESYAIPMRLCLGHITPMKKPFKEALDLALKRSGRSLRSIAIEAGVSYDQLKGLMQGKSRSTNVDDGLKVASAFGVSVEDFFSGNISGVPASIAVPGQAGAGAEVFLYDDHAKGDGLYHVACPP